MRIRADVLERLPGGGFGLREVKASARVKPEHLDDCAVQLHVLEGCGLRIDSVELVHVNPAYLRERGRDRLGRLLRAQPISRARWPPRCRACASAWLASTPWCARRARPRSSRRATASLPTTASSGITARAAKPDDWIFHLPRIGKRFETLRAAGIERIVDIPDELAAAGRSMSGSARRFGTGGCSSSPDSATRFARPTRPPTTSTSRRRTPRFRSTPARGRTRSSPSSGRSTRTTAAASLRHREFLADGAADPRREFAETLVAALRRRRRARARLLVLREHPARPSSHDRFPDLAPALGRIRDRLFDLLPVVRSHLYHPDFDFSFSIKAVAPALAPGLDWSDLDAIAEGAAASAAFASPRGRPGPGRRARAACAPLCAATAPATRWRWRACTRRCARWLAGPSAPVWYTPGRDSHRRHLQAARAADPLPRGLGRGEPRREGRPRRPERRRQDHHLPADHARGGARRRADLRSIAA